MSNDRKIISLKKITTKPKPIPKQDNETEQLVALQQKIAQSKHDIALLEEQKNNMMQDITQSINEEKAAWKEEKQQERETAQKTGYEHGYTEGKAEAAEIYSEKIVEANEIVKRATEDYYRTVSKYEDAIITLAITAARKIIGNELKTDPNVVSSIITKAIVELKDQSKITIYVHPEDYVYVIKQKDELEQLMETDELLSIYPDQQLQLGDCIIKHPFGQVDVGIDTQLIQIKNALEEKLGRDHNGFNDTDQDD